MSAIDELIEAVQVDIGDAPDNYEVAELARAALPEIEALRQRVKELEYGFNLRGVEYPAGAIHNGETAIDRLASDYPLLNSDDWQTLKQCFWYLCDVAGQSARLRQQWRPPEEAEVEREYLIKYSESWGGESTKLAYMDKDGYWEGDQGSLQPTGILAIADLPEWTEADERRFGGES